MNEDRKNNSKSWYGPWEFVVCVLVIGVLLLIAIPSIAGPLKMGKVGLSLRKGHSLAIAAFNYSNDANGIFPSGASSTAIFQLLYDQKYLQDAHDLFLTSNGGKSISPASGHASILKPENISWDFVTRANSGLNSADNSVDMPLIISDVDTAPPWSSGVNSATISSADPLGIEGVTVVTLDSSAKFMKAGSVPGEAPLTTIEFQLVPGVNYMTRKP